MATLEKGKFPIELVKILKELSSEWEIIDSNNFEISPLGAGFHNQLYKLTWLAKKENQSKSVREVLVRIYGKGNDLSVDREEEEKTFELVSQGGQGPKFYGCFPNGRVEEFIQGRTLYPHELRNPKFSALIAATIRKFHSIDRPGPRNIIIWDRLRNWLRKGKLCSTKHIEEFSISNLEEEINLLEKELSNESQVVAFCHNDVHSGNMLFQETTQTLTLIDYEFSGYNSIAFEFANYFCEMTSDYYSDTPHLMDLNKYPGQEERQNFINLYLTSEGYKPTKLNVEQLTNDAEKYTLACHLLYGLWGIISVANANNDKSFNYMGHARQRFQQYWQQRLKLLGAIENFVNK